MNAVYRQIDTAIKEYKKYPNYFLSLTSILDQIEWALVHRHISVRERDDFVVRVIMLHEAERMGMDG